MNGSVFVVYYAVLHLPNITQVLSHVHKHADSPSTQLGMLMKQVYPQRCKIILIQKAICANIPYQGHDKAQFTQF